MSSIARRSDCISKFSKSSDSNFSTMKALSKNGSLIPERIPEFVFMKSPDSSRYAAYFASSASAINLDASNSSASFLACSSFANRAFISSSMTTVATSTASLCFSASMCATLALRSSAGFGFCVVVVVTGLSCSGSTLFAALVAIPLLLFFFFNRSFSSTCALIFKSFSRSSLKRSSSFRAISFASGALVFVCD